MGNACYYSVEKLLSSSLLSKNLKVRIYKAVTLPVVLYDCETWILTLRDEQRLRVFENKVLRKIFGAKRDEVTGEWRKLHNAELHTLYPSPDVDGKLRKNLNQVTCPERESNPDHLVSRPDALNVTPQKIVKFNLSMGIINRVLKSSLVQKSTRTRLYQIIARPVLCYGGEAWTIRTKDGSRLTACEMRFMCRTAGYTKWDRKKNEDILQELNVSSILDYISRYQLNWKEHVSRMVSSRIPKAIMKYSPNGKLSLRRPKKRWQENRFFKP
ncbi:hypothetical protein ANN_20920 [Periplaneta americana]|uniref:Uncharacterized protein n=1 Tax=Periplaneta americana TaxID=6978 RepID=A0ABQ8SET4_PERAM|nr:hypothetical protein ANN_20920 [Periplaneta americana]